MGYPITSKEQLVFAVEKSGKRILEFGVKHLGFFNGLTADTLNSAQPIEFYVEFEEGHQTFDNFTELTKLLEGITERKVELLTRETYQSRFRDHSLKDVQYVQLGN